MLGAMRARFVFPCSVAAEAALDAMTRSFVAAGYTVRAREPGIAKLVFAVVRPPGPSPDARHQLRVKCDGTRVVCVFASVGGPLIPETRKAFGDRVRAAAASLGAPAGTVKFKPMKPGQGPARDNARAHDGAAPVVVVKEQKVVVRCKYCSKLTPVDARACEGCGATSFA
jgi:hypothetical protein